MNWSVPRFEHDYFSNKIGRWSIYVLLSLATIVSGVSISWWQWSLREISILFFVILSVLIMVVPNDSLWRIVFGIGVASIGLGWRTMALTSNLMFVPFEVIIWILCLAMLFRALMRRQILQIGFSRPLLFFLLWCAIAFITALWNNVPLDSVIGYGKNILLLAPMWLVVKNLAPDRSTWWKLIWITIGTSLYLSLVGLALQINPEWEPFIREVFGTHVFDTPGFTRIGFPGWGPLAAWFFVLVFALILGLWENARNRLTQLSCVAMLLVIGGGILISGQRGAWLALLVGLAVYALFNPQKGIAFGSLVLILLILVPEGNVVSTRFISAFDPTLFDSSATDRYIRASIAIDTLATNPIIGLGFGKMVYVHNDYLEIGVALGGIALGLFLSALGVTAWKLVKLCRTAYSRSLRWMSVTVLVMFTALIVEFASAGYVTLSFMTIVPWFFWAMADHYTCLVEPANGSIHSS